MSKITTPKGRVVELCITSVHGTSGNQSGRIRYHGVNVASYVEGGPGVSGDPYPTGFFAGKNLANLPPDALAWQSASDLQKALIRADKYIDQLGFVE